ncbi:MAG: hypothetical protein H7336_14815 [Bacteriovorax sp.]|nr:hypothetical protein [Bacteriovorax sp.]
MKKMMLILMAVASLSAFAQDEKVNVCKADAAKYCKEFKTVRELPKCLRMHKEEVGSECRAVLDRSAKDSQEKYNSCKGDLGKFCKSAPYKLACLHENYEKLSASCKSKIKK